MTGSYIEFETYADNGYTAGNLILDGTTLTSLKTTAVVKEDTIVVSAVKPIAKKVTVDIKAPDNTTIRVIFDDETVTVGSNQTKQVIKDYNSKYVVYLTTHSDYNAGTLNIKRVVHLMIVLWIQIIILLLLQLNLL